MLAGELRNSSGSSLEYLKPIWPKLAAMHINTVLTAVYWELLEPKEGQFDFTLVDGAIQARRTTICGWSSCGSEAGRTASPATLPRG